MMDISVTYTSKLFGTPYGYSRVNCSGGIVYRVVWSPEGVVTVDQTINPNPAQ